MNWWDSYSSDLLDQLSLNERPFGLCVGWMQEAFFAMPFEDRQIYGNDGWVSDSSAAVIKTCTFRLRPDWTRPEQKGGRWEYCEVLGYSIDNKHTFRRWSIAHDLYVAFSMVGFGGIEFKELPNTWHMGPMFVNHHSCMNGHANNDDGWRPATPVRVRFWVES